MLVCICVKNSDPAHGCSWNQVTSWLDRDQGSFSLREMMMRAQVWSVTASPKTPSSRGDPPGEGTAQWPMILLLPSTERGPFLQENRSQTHRVLEPLKLKVSQAQNSPRWAINQALASRGCIPTPHPLLAAAFWVKNILKRRYSSPSKMRVRMTKGGLYTLASLRANMGICRQSCHPPNISEKKKKAQAGND